MNTIIFDEYEVLSVRWDYVDSKTVCIIDFCNSGTIDGNTKKLKGSFNIVVENLKNGNTYLFRACKVDRIRDNTLRIHAEGFYELTKGEYRKFKIDEILSETEKNTHK